MATLLAAPADARSVSCHVSYQPPVPFLGAGATAARPLFPADFCLTSSRLHPQPLPVRSPVRVAARHPVVPAAATGPAPATVHFGGDSLRCTPPTAADGAAALGATTQETPPSLFFKFGGSRACVLDMPLL